MGLKTKTIKTPCVSGFYMSILHKGITLNDDTKLKFLLKPVPGTPQAPLWHMVLLREGDRDNCWNQRGPSRSSCDPHQPPGWSNYMIEWLNSNKMPKGWKLTWVKGKWGQFPHSWKTRWMLRVDSSLYPTSPPWLIEERITLLWERRCQFSPLLFLPQRKEERTKISGQRATPTGSWFPKGQR